MDQDRDPSQTLHWQKVKFLHEKFMVLKVDTYYIKNITYILKKVQKPFYGQETRFIVNFGQFSCSWVRISIPNTDPEPDPEAVK
jgi:hypothetical protein